jgi:hypothetical protein
MKPVRFSVASFLVGVAALAAAFGALESNSELVASLVFSLNLLLLSFALVGAIVAAGSARRFWIGFIAFGGIYSLVAFGFLFPSPYRAAYVASGYTQANDQPQLLTSRLLELYGAVRAKRSIGDRVSAQWSGGGLWPATIVAYQDGRYQVDWDDSSANEWVSYSQIHPVGRDLNRVGHSVFSLLFGFLGGVAAVCLFGPRDTKPVESVSASTAK